MNKDLFDFLSKDNKQKLELISDALISYRYHTYEGLSRPNHQTKALEEMIEDISKMMPANR